MTQDLEAYMDVDTVRGAHYGRSRIWNEEYAPHNGEQKVHIVRAIDVNRFIENFVAAASK